jgi:hypothetical protein
LGRRPGTAGRPEAVAREARTGRRGRSVRDAGLRHGAPVVVDQALARDLRVQLKALVHDVVDPKVK